MPPDTPCSDLFSLLVGGQAVRIEHRKRGVTTSKGTGGDGDSSSKTGEAAAAPGGRKLIRVSGHADHFHRLSEGMLVKQSKGNNEQRTYVPHEPAPES